MKYQIIDTLLSTGRVLNVAVDPQRGASLPKHLMKADHVVLAVGYAMPVPIPDLRLSATGFCGTLIFDRRPFTVSVPWSAVYSAWDEYGTLVQWHDVPSKVELGGQPQAPKLGGNVVSMADYKARRIK